MLDILPGHVGLSTDIGHISLGFHTEQATHVPQTVFAGISRFGADE